MEQKSYPLEKLFGAVINPFERFLRQTTSGGIILVVMTICTLLIANSPWEQEFHYFWERPVSISFGFWILALPLREWINEGLMTLFFFVIGLELKREILVGELSSFKNAILPVAGAIGGMIMPAFIYALFNSSGSEATGWGIPMATDIAFAVGILVLLAWRIPRNLVIFLMALAIADDLGAVLIISLFYTQAINLTLLGIAGGLFLVLVFFNRGGIRHVFPYAVIGILLWLALLESGIHATVAGIILAFMIPARPSHTPLQFDMRIEELKQAFLVTTLSEDCSNHPLSNHCMAAIAEEVERTAKAVQSPLQRLEHMLSPWVTFGVIPLFAAANVGIHFPTLNIVQMMVHPVTLGVIVGLVAGKFIGIAGMSWLAVKAGIAQLPTGVRWSHLLGAAWLGGIGFTMALFISHLAFASDLALQEAATLGILISSVIASGIGLVWLLLATKEQHAQLLDK
ncbi:sodium/proton antiporter, NhaA family [Syntrophus gentianae]|uniref:Na(+)/H(+) antiporter NhaA n=1 Tax=Syntrophus gentianae TaxID=43775 RepID=A0A1H7VU92_9BACT|nr:Na+/H+ antiporter NhaA [Syntrophus gentianae]SEM12387.1 sodium/proton antiporter, NhaA family [Syntrophus gentianae]